MLPSLLLLSLLPLLLALSFAVRSGGGRESGASLDLDLALDVSAAEEDADEADDAAAGKGGCCLDVQFELNVDRRQVGARLQAAAPASSARRCGAGRRQAGVLPGSALGRKWFVPAARVEQRTTLPPPPELLAERLEALKKDDPELHRTLESIRSSADALAKAYEDDAFAERLGRALLPAPGLARKPEEASCRALLTDVSLLYDLGTIIHGAIGSFPVSDEGWDEAQYLKNHPDAVGASVVVRRGWAQVTQCSRSSFGGEGPLYSARPSAFLQWFACQDLKNIDALAAAMNVRVDGKPFRVLDRLRSQVEASAMSHMLWSFLLVEQALRDQPSSALAASASLPTLGGKLTAVLDTFDVYVDDIFAKARREGKPEPAVKALGDLQFSMLQEGLLGLTSMLYASSAADSVARGTFSAASGSQPRHSTDAVLRADHLVGATAPAVATVPENVARVTREVPAAAFSPKFNAEVLYKRTEVLAREANSVMSSEKELVRDGLVATGVYPPARVFGGTNMFALLKRTWDEMGGHLFRSSIIDLVVDPSTSNQSTGDHPYGYVDHVPKIVGRHALAMLGDAVGWTPFHVSDEKGETPLAHYEGCTRLFKDYAGKLSTRTIENVTFPYVDELSYTPDGDSGRGTAVFLLPKHDHNGAFQIEDRMCARIACQASQGLSILVKAVAGPKEALTVIDSFAAGAIEHVTFSGHGSPESLQWGEGVAGLLHTRSPLTEPLLNTLGQKLTPDATVVLDACTTAKGSELRPPQELTPEKLKATGPKNLFEFVKIIVGQRKVYAPTRPYTENDYHMAADIGNGACMPDARHHRWQSILKNGTGQVLSALELQLLKDTPGGTS